MKIKPNDPPRVFYAGKKKNKEVYISDMGDIHLNPNEQVTFVTDSGNRHDFCRKIKLCTPSMNSRLKNENFITAMVINKEGFNYIMVVERSKIKIAIIFKRWKFNCCCLVYRSTWKSLKNF